MFHVFKKSAAFLLILFTITTAFAQDNFHRWQPEDGVAVRQGRTVFWTGSGASRTEGDNSGEIALVWSDTRNGSKDVFVQVIDADGNPKFEENGLAVCTAPLVQENPVIYAATDGGWYVAWEDSRDEALTRIYCTKINENGELLWGEDTNGIIVCAQEDDQAHIQIVDDGNGGCIVIWLNHGTNLMHIFDDGRQDPNWQEGGITLENIQNYTAITDNEGGVILGWFIDSANNHSIRSQRIMADGELAWGDDDGILITGDLDIYIHYYDWIIPAPEFAPDGEGGAFVCWTYWDPEGMLCKDIWAQRLTGEGRLMWGENGMPLCSLDDFQWLDRITSSEQGSAIVMWDGYGYSAMRMTGEDELQKMWEPDSGVQLNENIFVYNGRITSDLNGGAYAAWGARGEERDDLSFKTQHVNADGEREWGNDGIIVIEDYISESTPIMLSTQNGCAFAWQDTITTRRGILAQRLSPDGKPDWGDGIEIVEGYAGGVDESKLLSLGNGSFAAVWIDERECGFNSSPYIQICSDANDHAEFLCENNGIPIVTDMEGYSPHMEAINDENGNVFVVWENHIPDQPYTIYAQSITPNGERCWGEAGIRCAESDSSQREPLICSDGDDGVYVIWWEDQPGHIGQLFIQHISANGEKLFGNSGIRLNEEHWFRSNYSIVSDGESGAVVLCEVRNPDRREESAWITRITANGEQVWGDGNGLIIISNERRSSVPRLFKHLDGFIVTWGKMLIENEYDMISDIYGQFINFDGELQWSADGNSICKTYGYDYEYEYRFTYDLTVDNNGFIWIVTEVSNDSTRYRDPYLHIQKINPVADRHGRIELLFEDNRRLLPELIEQRSPEIVSDANGGVWILWGDYRNGYSDIYATHLQADGEPYEGWSETGNPICDAVNTPSAALLRSNGSTGIVTLWEDSRSSYGQGGMLNLYCQRVDDGQLSVPISRENDAAKPADFTLTPAYPNPFNSRTGIRYNVITDGYIKISLYDATGRLVRQISNEIVTAGSHVLTIDAKDLCTGLYIVRFEAGDVKLEQKIVLVK
jgi:hypothetical protein